MNETVKRIISGVIIAAYFIFAFNYDGLYRLPLFLFVFVAVGIGLSEFYNLTTHSYTHRPHRKTGLVVGLSMVVGVYLHYLPQKYPSILQSIPFLKNIHLGFHLITALFFFTMVYLYFRQLTGNRNEGALYSTATTFLGLIYVPLTAVHIFLLDAMPWGNFYIWLLAFMTVMSDTMQYTFGKLFGKTKVGIVASPNKTWEGYWGGLLGQVVLSQIFYFVARKFFSVPEFAFWEILLLSIIIFVISVIGDLSESMLKRDAQVKDSGNVIPGHGGILDLVDALLLTIPASYYFLVFRQYLQNL
ncbi:MAG: phosphatidate cytidylyltransferase [Leptospiraceae bacterium]|nr:phosphatidate cytidylyltransferase [Leptospiraceae bacterium]MDW8306256.1 phosphatidate cytidylyltransferase [Leptospiraceae bacterium]